MLPQETLIERVRELCESDDRLVAAMMYGSFTRSEGDAFSDIEFVLFFEGAAHERIDPEVWLSQVAPVELCFVNEFGHHTAIFDSLIRGEFHFEPASKMAQVESWKNTSWFPSLEATLIVDRTGELSRRLQPLIGSPPPRDTPEQAAFLCHSFLNWTLFGVNVLARGESARSLEILGTIHRYLLWMVRLLERSTEHWPTPSKSLERDLSPAAHRRFAACSAHLDEAALRRAYRESWDWGRTMMADLAGRHGNRLPQSILEAMDRRFPYDREGWTEEDVKTELRWATGKRFTG